MDVAGTIRNKLSALLMPGGKGDGLIGSRQEYNRYAAEANEAGTPALPFEQWLQSRKARPNALMSPKPMVGDDDVGYMHQRR
jgi:hypothetical protein